MKKEPAVMSTTKIKCVGRTIYTLWNGYDEGSILQWTPKGKKNSVPAIFAREDLAKDAKEAMAMDEYNYLIREGEDEEYARNEAEYIRTHYQIAKHEIFKEVEIPKKARKPKPKAPARRGRGGLFAAPLR
jgi:hypothetical protein